jgi:hypothetical protein
MARPGETRIVEETNSTRETAMTVITEPEAVATEPQAPSIYEAIGGRPSVKAAHERSSQVVSTCLVDLRLRDETFRRPSEDVQSATIVACGTRN